MKRSSIQNNNNNVSTDEKALINSLITKFDSRIKSGFLVLCKPENN